MTESADDPGTDSATCRARRRTGLLAAAGALFALVFAATALASAGKLTQLSGTDGCISADGTGGACTDGSALDGASSVAVSPDGKNAYVASDTDSGVAIFDRDKTSGELTQLSGTDGCISATGSGGACADGVGLGGASSVAVSPDGKNVYVAASLAVVILDRDPTTGKLTEKAGTAGCISENGTSGAPDFTSGACVDGVALSGVNSVAVSPDGKNVYATSYSSDAIAILDRNTSTGALTQKAGTAGCISISSTGGACAFGLRMDGPSSITVSPDGNSAYVASYFSDAVDVFDRNPTTGALTQKSGTDGCVSQTGSGDQCADGEELDGARAVAVSDDGKSAYVASRFSDAVAGFDRDATTGVLTQKSGTDGCVSHTGSGGVCADGVVLSAPASVTVSPDGKSAYVTSFTADAVSVFDRDTESGTLTQKADTDACVSETGNGGQCADGVALDGPVSVAVSPDGDSAYAASSVSDAVAVFDRNDGVIDGKASAPKTQKQKGKNIVVKVKVKTGETLDARAQGEIVVKKRSFGLNTVKKSVAEGKPVTLKLKPARSNNSQKIAKALKKSKAKAKISVVISDDGGNSKTSKLAVTLKAK